MTNEEETMSYDEAADTLGLSKAAREGVDMLEQHKRDMQASGVANKAGVDPTKLGGSTTPPAAYGREKPIGTDLGKPLGTPMSEVSNSTAQTADGRPVEEQASTRMMNLMNRGVTTKGLEKAGTSWDAILNKETSDKEAVQQTNFAAFAAKAQKDKDRLKGKANDLILKAAGDIYASMVDQSNAGDKTGIVKDGDNYYRAQSVTDPEVLRMVNEARAKLGMKDSVKGIAVKMQVNKETGETYGDPVFDITMQKDGYIKDGGAIQRSPMMTLADIQRLQEKAYRGMGVANPAEETTARFGDHLTMRKFRAEALAAAANPKSALEGRAMGVKETEAGAKKTEAEAKKTLNEAQAKAYADGVLALGGGARLSRAQLADDKQMNDLAFKAYKLAWDSAKTDADRDALRDSAAWMNNWIAQKRGEASQAQGGQPEPTADNIMDDQYKTKGGRVNPGVKDGATTPPPAQTAAQTQTAQPARNQTSDQYDTPIPENLREKYEKWKAQLPENLQYTGDYDLQGAWLEKLGQPDTYEESQNGHLDDYGKKPNHPTFSSGSKWHDPSIAERAGGEWKKSEDGSWDFYPGTGNKLTDEQLEEYFNKHEKGNRVHKRGSNKTTATSQSQSQSGTNQLSGETANEKLKAAVDKATKAGFKRNPGESDSSFVSRTLRENGAAAVSENAKPVEAAKSPGEAYEIAGKIGIDIIKSMSDDEVIRVFGKIGPNFPDKKRRAAEIVSLLEKNGNLGNKVSSALDSAARKVGTAAKSVAKTALDVASKPIGGGGKKKESASGAVARVLGAGFR